MDTIQDRNLPEVKEGEMSKGHMKNARNIPFPKLFKRKSKQLTKEEYQKCKCIEVDQFIIVIK